MLIGITGSKGSGKDTFAEAFTCRQFVNVKLAGPLKNMMTSLYLDAQVPEADIEAKIEGDLKETPCEVLAGATPRLAMQTLGTEWARMVDDTHGLWVRVWMRRVMDLMTAGVPVVCTDIRFHHEAAALRSLGGFLIRVTRPGLSVDDTHPSEIEMRELEVDWEVLNAGTIQDLHDTADNVLKGTQS